MEGIVSSPGQPKAAVPAIAAIDLSPVFTNEHLQSIKNIFFFFCCIARSHLQKHRHALKPLWFFHSTSLMQLSHADKIQFDLHTASVRQFFFAFTSLNASGSHESIASTAAATLCCLCFIWPWRRFYRADREGGGQTSRVNETLRRAEVEAQREKTVARGRRRIKHCFSANRGPVLSDEHFEVLAKFDWVQLGPVGCPLGLTFAFSNALIVLRYVHLP